MGLTFVDTEYTKAYLRHLFAANEYLGKQIATIHNLGFYMWLVREARKHIIAGDFRVWKEMMDESLEESVGPLSYFLMTLGEKGEKNAKNDTNI